MERYVVGTWDFSRSDFSLLKQREQAAICTFTSYQFEGPSLRFIRNEVSSHKFSLPPGSAMAAHCTWKISYWKSLNTFSCQNVWKAEQE